MDIAKAIQLMTSNITLTMLDGVRVVTTDSLDSITPYVLQEQQDWFEDEIKFLRRLLKPGGKVIDIGANHGVYALSMAKTVGPTGHVWAFEPASGTARLLAEGIAANGFTQVTLEQSALSSKSGTAQLSLNANSELNALVRDQSTASASETVPLVTLDECLERYGWHDIELVKIDAEGEEANILKGGERFFAELSPLILYEIRADEKINLGLVQNFAALGYSSYRLAPGLGLLIPFDSQSSPDGYLLNLFCCKPDRAGRLAAQGYLLGAADVHSNSGVERLKKLAQQIGNRHAYEWRNTIAKLPYGILLNSAWEQTVAAGNSTEVAEALFLYALSRNPSLPAIERHAALEGSFSSLQSLCERQPSYLRLASLARVARDYGARLVAANALNQLRNNILQHKRVELSEPFLAPGERFDSVPPGNDIGNWVLAAVLEEFERLGFFSSFYADTSALQRLKTIRGLGFGSAEMGRRLHLLQKRYGLPAS